MAVLPQRNGLPSRPQRSPVKDPPTDHLPRYERPANRYFALSQGVRLARSHRSKRIPIYTDSHLLSRELDARRHPGSRGAKPRSGAVVSSVVVPDSSSRTAFSRLHDRIDGFVSHRPPRSRARGSAQTRDDASGTTPHRDSDDPLAAHRGHGAMDPSRVRGGPPADHRNLDVV